MPVFKAKLSTIELAKGRFSDTLDEAMQVQIRQAARAFVRIAAVSVPVRTGFARGTFQNILDAAGQSPRGGTDAFGVGNFLNDLARIRSPKLSQQFPGLLSFKKGGLKAAKITSINGRKLEFYTGGGGKVPKLPGSGRQFATPPGQIFSKVTFVYSFNFAVNINYFNINDFFKNRRTPSSPWKSFERGKAFFFQYLRTTGLKKLPQVQDFFVETSVSVDERGISRTKLGVISRGKSTNG